MRAVLSWTELAAKAGVSAKVCTKIRQGGAVSPRTLRKLASALDIDAGVLVAVPNDGREGRVVGTGAA